MKTNVLRLSALLICAPLLVAGPGCVAAKNVASDTVGWIRGELTEVVDSPIDQVGRASTAAVNDMKFLSITSKVDAVEGEITAKTAQDTNITILLEKVTDKTTKISIRVGVFGDEAISRQIYGAIQKHL